MLKTTYTQAEEVVMQVLAFEFETAVRFINEKRWLPAGIIEMVRLKA